MSKRDTILNLIHNSAPLPYTPAAFFMHFDPAYHAGQGAVDQHLEFFRTTGMDFVKIQYEQVQPTGFRAVQADDWHNAPLYPPDYFDPTYLVAKGLVDATKREALVVVTLYSPLMWANQLTDEGLLAKHLEENPAAVTRGLEIMTQNVVNLVRTCKRAGVDGFYTSTQGGEAFRFPGTDFFEKYVKPTDLAVWSELQDCTFNILHICDYQGGYDDLTPFLDYPGHVVNCSLMVGGQHWTPKQATEFFGRPFMGGMERKGALAHGAADEIRQEAQSLLDAAPARFILGADCTIPGDAPWDNLRIAVETAHNHKP